MASRDGDGWVECSCGGKHWGIHGAAGLLLIRERTILLQHRAPWVHNGDTWAIPGGARDSHESWLEAALREAHEEIGVDPTMVEPITQFVDDHGIWSYVTIIAKARSEFQPREMNHESLELRWIDLAKVSERNLHLSFAKSWPAILEMIAQENFD